MLTGSDPFLQKSNLLTERVDTVQLLQWMWQEVGPVRQEAVTVSYTPHAVQREESGERS